MIEEMRSDYHLAELCDAMEISSSGYYKWRASAQSARSQSNEVLLREINKIHQDQHLRNYGSPRMTVELNNRGYPCPENRVARLMASEGISAHHTRKWKPRTTIQNPGSRASPNLLAKMPELTAPGQVWVSDITYVFTRQQTHYLAVIMDLFTREILGWELDSHMEASLVQKALQQAETKQGAHPGRVFHSDRGSQYTSDLVREHIENARYRQSMSALGYCYDNAACESFFATLKKECFPTGQTFDTPANARREIFRYLETFYNSRRIHSSLGNLSPQAFRQLSLQSN